MQETSVFLNTIRGLAEGGASGSIVSRNAFQRPREDALSLLGEIVSIYRARA